MRRDAELQSQRPAVKVGSDRIRAAWRVQRHALALRLDATAAACAAMTSGAAPEIPRTAVELQKSGKAPAGAASIDVRRSDWP